MTDTLRAPAEPAAGVTTAPTQPPAPVRNADKGTFSSLRYVDYRYLWIGTIFLSAGQWVQQVTLGWLLYDLTSSSLLLGALNGMRAIPFLLVGPFAGVVADRTDPRTVLKWVQGSLFVSAFVMGTIVITGHTEVWHLFVFTAITGVGWSVVQPVRQSMVSATVPKTDVANAVALASVGFNAMKVVGPSLGGFMVAAFGAGGNFYVQGVSYFAVFVLMFFMNIDYQPKGRREKSVLEDLKEGLAYCLHDRLMLSLQLVGLIPSMLAWPVQALMPVFQKDVLNAGPEALGFLLAAPGVGGVASMLLLASMANRMDRKGRFAIVALTLQGVSVVLFSFTRELPYAFAVMAVFGAVQLSFHATVMTILQISTPDRLRSRIVSIYMLNTGLSPLGSMAAGALAEWQGAPFAFFVVGVATVGFAALMVKLAPALWRWTPPIHAEA